MNARPLRLAVFGCGNMGGALLSRWLQAPDLLAEVTVVDPRPLGELPLPPTGHRIHSVTSAAALRDQPPPDVALLAVKPQQMDALLADVPPHWCGAGGETPSVLWLTIAAGMPLDWYASRLRHAVPRLVRAMPNTPARLGAGITALCADPALGAEDRALAERLFAQAGAVLWLEEARMDAFTAVAGSGPAYLFYFMEALTCAAMAAGFPEDAALRMARATVCGSALLAAESAEHPAELRRQVTSPGGTTAAALEVLMDPAHGLSPLLARAVEQAARRAAELRGQ